MKLFFSAILFSGFTFCPAFSQNTVYGTGAGVGGYSNTHIGNQAGRLSTGVANSFVGSASGYSNTTGSYNAFMGISSSYRNTSGAYNTFLGSYSGFYNTTGSQNTFVGPYSGYINTTGKYNTFVGTSSGGNSSGSKNTYLGHQTGYGNRKGNNNVFIGYKAAFHEKGSNKFYVEVDTTQDIGIDNSTPLLYGDFAKNTLSIGTKYTGSAYSLVVPRKVRATAYDVVSDERLKENVHRLSDALASVQQVEGVTYHFKADTSLSATDHKGKALHYGFLAQNIQQVFPELVTEEEGLLAVNYQGMIPVLVEALKSLSLKQDSVSQLKVQLTQVQQQNQQLEAELSLIKQALQAKGLLKAEANSRSSSRNQESSLNPAVALSQNQPNPFNQTTTIVYQAPVETKQVSLVITNFSGVEVQRFANLPASTGEVILTAGSLSPGTYVYTLVIDGKAAASHKMVLTRK